MPRTYIDRQNGRNKQASAIAASAGAPDANKLVGTGADGKLDVSLLPNGVGQDVQSFVASEAISGGALINIHAGGMRNADATAEGREANGFVLAGVANGASGNVYFDGTISGLAGLTVGSRYYMSETAGELTAVPVAGTGKVDQCVGIATSATTLSFEPEDPITLA